MAAVPNGGKTPIPPKIAGVHTTFAAWGFAILYLGYVGFLILKFVLGDGADKNWEHALVILNAVSAIGFAAVGVLLGTTVQQVNVANAEKKADKAMLSEGKVAEGAKELADAAAEKLAKTSDLKDQFAKMSGDQAFWARTINPADERLRQALRQMNKVLEGRVADA